MITTKIWVYGQPFSTNWPGQSFLKIRVANMTADIIHEAKQLDVEGELIFWIDGDVENLKLGRSELMKVDINCKNPEHESKLRSVVFQCYSGID